MRKLYVGQRRADGSLEVLVVEGDQERPLPLRLDLRRHSPTGFEAGYHGSGPAQLALALLVDVLEDEELALEQYQTFKRQVVALLPREFVLAEADIRAALFTLH
jgi:hypothetical protein